MKPIVFTSLLLLLGAPLLHANPEIATVIDREYGAATAEGIVLLQSVPSAADPVEWAVFARDPFRPSELVRAAVGLQNNSWVPKPVAAGRNLMGQVPSQAIAFNRVRFRTGDVRRIAQQSALLSKTNFATIQYQLAANATTSSPEWGLALLDIRGAEVGFLVVSAETGAVTHQQWNNRYIDPTVSRPPPGSKGERAADDVRRAARNTWNRTEDTGVEVGRFFKRLFKN